MPPVRRLRGQVFGIIGLGRIGLAVAARAAAFQMAIAFHDPYLPAGIEHSLGYRRAVSFEELPQPVRRREPALPADAGDLRAHRRPGDRGRSSQIQSLINTSRGGTVDLDAVERGLRSGRLLARGVRRASGRAARPAPIPLIAAWSRQEAWLEGRLVLTPHAAFYTPESLADMRRLSMLAVMRFPPRGTPP